MTGRLNSAPFSERLVVARIPWELDEDEYWQDKRVGVPDSVIWSVPGRRYG